jgi:hypothetical protein
MPAVRLQLAKQDQPVLVGVQVYLQSGPGVQRAFVSGRVSLPPATLASRIPGGAV